MSKLMLILGIIMAAIGLALGVMVFSSPAQLQVWGITPETAAILFTGGVLSMGLGGVISALASGSMVAASVADAIPAVAEAVTHDEIFPSIPEPAPETVVQTPAPEAAPAPKKNLFGFGRKTAEVVTAGAAIGAVAEAAIPTNKSVAETLEALEQAKAELKASVGLPATPAPAAVVPEIPPAIPEVVEATAEVGEEDAVADSEADLYVVEEQVVRGHPARVLSDGTVEAETSEGWMRFENLEHLNEYLDATENA